VHVRRASIAILLAAACAAASPSRADQAEEPVLVHYPAGACQTGRIEIQIWNRATAAWMEHPEHPLVEAGSCQLELAHLLLNELRIRCVDPDGLREPSEWVSGVTLRPRASASPCPP